MDKKLREMMERFLPEPERERILKAVRDAEKRTSGEIVPMIVPASYHYPVADIMGGVALSFPLAVFFAWFESGRLLGTPWNLWVFLIAFLPLFIIFKNMTASIPSFKRIFISEEEMEAEVKEAAMTAFDAHGLRNTRDENGILIFVSVFERKVCILADKGINNKVDPDYWKRIVSHITAGIRQGRPGPAISEAVFMIADVLEKHFPIKPDDTDELSNLIIEDA